MESPKLQFGAGQLFYKLHQQGFNKIKNSPQLLFAICLKYIQSKKTRDQLARLNPLVQ